MTFQLSPRKGPGLRTSKRMKIFLIALFLAVITVASALASEVSLYGILGLLSCIIVAATLISVNRGRKREGRPDAAGAGDDFASIFHDF